jgi:hypothetical protein
MRTIAIISDRLFLSDYCLYFTTTLARYYFSRSQVEHVARSREKALTAEQAAKRAEVTVNTIRKWTRSGKLKPVSGPSIDGSAMYLYDRDAVKAACGE